MKNNTLTQLQKDPRVLSVRNEGEDGWWADLADGYILQPDETTAIHAATLSEIKRALSRVRPI